jgi:hypothetical protein
MGEKVLEFSAQWDAEVHVWWCSNDTFPVTAEATAFDELIFHVFELPPEIAGLNSLAAASAPIEVHAIAAKRGAAAEPIYTGFR